MRIRRGRVRGVASPAHAGIDRRSAATSRRSRCFPRARGDRPSAAEADRAGRALPPRTRGSTPALQPPRCRVGASPAHAGIDPRGLAEGSVFRCFPRARGDRPLAAEGWGEVRMLPPRTRGSTARDPPAHNPPMASPAHAGIDPRLAYIGRVREGFPRARGDRPHSPHPGPAGLLLPPRTRGSTHSFEWVASTEHASPAHAGIDRCARQTRSSATSFPRARGDRPRARMDDGVKALLPPRTRGSTGGVLPTDGPRAASPAHAGIDP